MKQKVWSIVLALALCLGLLSAVSVLAAEDTETTTIYFDNSVAGWDTVNAYAWDAGRTSYLGDWPGTAMTQEEDSIYSIAVPVGAGMIIFNNGAAQTGDQPLGTGNCFKATADGSGTWYTYPCTHAGGSYTYPDNGTHTIVCNDCGADDTVEHSFGNTGACVCGAYGVLVAGVRVAGVPDGDGNIDVTALVKDTNKVSGTVTFTPAGGDWDDPDTSKLENAPTLTLSGASIAGEALGDAINSESALNLVLTGENEVTGDYGIMANDARMTISGGGSLTLDVRDYGLSAYSLTVEDVTVNIDSETVNYGAVVLAAGGAIKDSTVKAVGTSSDYQKAAIYTHRGTLEIDNSSVYVESGYIGIYGSTPDVSVILNGDAHVKVDGKVMVNGGVTSDGVGYLRTSPGGDFARKEAGSLETDSVFEYVGAEHLGEAKFVDSSTHSYLCKCEDTTMQATVTEGHSLTYSANGGVITESCSCSHRATATLTPPAEPLIWNDQTRAATVEYSADWMGEEGTILYTGTGADGAEYADSTEAPRKPGTYTAGITIGGAAARVTFTIEKAAASVNTAPAAIGNLIYTGAAQELVTAGTVNAGEQGVTMQYSLDENGAYSGNIPTAANAGSYTVWYKAVGGDYHNDSTPVSVPVTIGKRDISSAAITLGGELTYNGREQTMAVSSVAVGSLTLTDADYTVSGNTGTDAGDDYQLTVTAEDGGNFTGSATETWSIARAPMTITADDQTMTIGKSVPALTCTITGFVNGEAESVLTTRPTVSCEATGAAAGTYPITVSGAAADNYAITYVNGTLTVYAVVTLDGNGASSDWEIFVAAGQSANAAARTQGRIENNEDIGEVLGANTVRDGYTFVGWFRNEDGTGDPYDFNSEVTTNITLYAKWTPAALTGTVTVSGTMQVGQTLTATVTDTNNTGTLSYQWYRCVERDEAISGAAGSTYTLTVEDLTFGIYCSVTSSVQTDGIRGYAAGTVARKDAPAAPTGLAAAAPSAPTASDGKITGVTTAMEYSADGTNWTDCTGAEITGLASGTYYIRLKETADTAAGVSAAVIVPAVYTVTFDENGGDSGWEIFVVSGQSANQAFEAAYPESQDTAAQVFVSTRNGYNFAGWYTTADGGEQFDFNAPVTQNTTLYAKWSKEPVYDITGLVMQARESGEAVPASGVTVTLRQGNAILFTKTTDSNGAYDFHAPAGTYNIVAEKDHRTMTQLVVVTDHNEQAGAITLPWQNVSSELTVPAGTPDIVVGGLDEEVLEYANDANDTTHVTLSMTVEQKEDVTGKDDLTEEEAEHKEQQAAIKTAAGGQKNNLTFLEITLEQSTTSDGSGEGPSGSTSAGSGSSAVTETSTLLEIIVPFETSGRQDFKVYRYHDGRAETLKENPGEGEEGFVVGNGVITICAKKFSAYAIGYSEPVYVPTYKITVEGGGNGTIKVNRTYVTYGTTVTVTVTPEEGYELDALTVTDGAGKTIEVTHKGEGKFTFRMPSRKVTVAAAFRPVHTCPGAGYTDVDRTLWYHEAIDYVLERGLVDGVTATAFDPNGTATRALLVTALWRNEGCPVADHVLPYTDVASGQWYTEAIRWATAVGIVNGFPDGGFHPNEAITREQLATLFYRYERYKGEGFIGEWVYELPYADAGLVGDWAYEAVCWNTLHGIVQGDGTNFDPRGTATRAHVAQLLMNYLEQ